MKYLLLLVALAACSEERTIGQPCEGSGSDCTVRVHPTGWKEDHAADLKARKFDFKLCASCHGDDFAGGKSGVSCMSCHKEGPTACVTCHGDGAPEQPKSGRHSTHITTAQLDCAECHTNKPTSWDNHPDTTQPVQVMFGARANLTPQGATRAADATFDGTSCSNVYCHGAVLPGPSGGTLTAPHWDDQTATGSCNTCHGQPPPSHARADCQTCHPATAPHIDGTIQIGRTSGCDGCHGSAQSPAPPTDLSGNIYTTAIGVGAHQAHLQAPSGLRGPVSCDTCHVVPATVTSPGHLDAGPAKVTASLGWDRTSQTCASAWCHGDPVHQTFATPVWTTQGQVVCGSCHGVPPTGFPHDPSMKLTDCASCHPLPPSSEHINGTIDVN